MMFQWKTIYVNSFPRYMYILSNYCPKPGEESCWLSLASGGMSKCMIENGDNITYLWESCVNNLVKHYKCNVHVCVFCYSFDMDMDFEREHTATPSLDFRSTDDMWTTRQGLLNKRQPIPTLDLEGTCLLLLLNWLMLVKCFTSADSGTLYLS